MTTTPRHLQPTACYICGGTEHATAKGGHAYWSNADADAYFKAEDAQRTVRYSDGTTTPEAHYVATYRPY